MTPSVEGAERVKVGVLLAGAASATGALAGFAAGTAWAIAHLPRLPAEAAPRVASLRRREPLAFALLTGAIVLGCAVLA